MLALEGRGAPTPSIPCRRDRRLRTLRLRARGKRPDGTPVKVAFSLAFAPDPEAPDVGFFTCQHHYPENFWNPAFQVHANTAIGVPASCWSPTIRATIAFLVAFTGDREMLATSAGIAHQDAARRNPGDGPRRRSATTFGVAPPDPSRGRAARRPAIFRPRPGYRGGRSAGKAESAQLRTGRIVVGPDAALGATLVFEGS